MKKKKTKLKIKKKNALILAGVIIAILLINPVISIIKLTSKGYSFAVSFELYKDGAKDEALDSKYSKTLDHIAGTRYFDASKVNSYLDIKFMNYKDFNKNIYLWLDLGYTAKDINKINERKDENLNKISSKTFIKDISSYLDYSYFKSDNLSRYVNYFNGDYQNTIVSVNIGLDKPIYENPSIVKEFSTTILVNKYNGLDESFEPDDLVELTKCSGKGQYLSLEAKEAYDELCDASIKDGMSLGVTSSYRDHDEQQEIYDENLKENGKEYTDEFVAKPLFSEHETGLTLDVKSTKASPFKFTKEYEWMMENAYKYGFILRYPEGKENITGYKAEAWHFRYVGKEIAEYIYENDITYEEYCAMFY